MAISTALVVQGQVRVVDRTWPAACVAMFCAHATLIILVFSSKDGNEEGETVDFSNLFLLNCKGMFFFLHVTSPTSGYYVIYIARWKAWRSLYNLPH